MLLMINHDFIFQISYLMIFIYRIYQYFITIIISQLNFIRLHLLMNFLKIALFTKFFISHKSHLNTHSQISIHMEMLSLISLLPLAPDHITYYYPKASLTSFTTMLHFLQ